MHKKAVLACLHPRINRYSVYNIRGGCPRLSFSSILNIKNYNNINSEKCQYCQLKYKICRIVNDR